MTTPDRCRGTKADGTPCGSLPHMIRENGYCPAHDPDDPRQIREARSLGGIATAARNHSEPFTREELPALVDLDDAMRALDQVRIAAMMRRLTHAEANAASKAVSEWVKAYEVNKLQTQLDELQSAHDRKDAEIAQLRKQITTLQGRSSGPRMVS